MKTAEDKLVDEAIAGTEKEIFGAAFGEDGTVASDDAADTSLEEMEDDASEVAEGDGEGGSDDDAGDDDDAEGDAEGEEGKGEKPDAEKPNRDDEGKFAEKGDKPNSGDQRGQKPGKGDVTVPLRAERQRAAKLETDLEAERRERATEREALRSEMAKLEGRLDQVLKGQTAQPKADAKSEVTDAEPDMFVDPKAWNEWRDRREESRIAAVRQEFQNQRLEASFEEASEKHGKSFEAAYDAVNKLSPQNPAHVAIVNSIRTAPNPGARLMKWHRQQEALRKVGDDPDAFINTEVERVLKEKMQDPEFLKTLIAQNRGGADDGNGQQQQRGNVRNIIRNPRSLNSEGGRAQRANDTDSLDGSDAAVFASAFR